LIVGVQSVVEWDRRGVVTGASMFTRMLGQAVGAAVFGTVANTTLDGWFAHAPGRVARQLPHTVNSASSVIGKRHGLSPVAAAYVRHGLDLATHRVFLGLVACAALGLAVVLLTPRRFALD
jgi:hypothetical protein